MNTSPASATAPRGVRVIAVIPARGGSRGVPRKNLLTLRGRPILAYTLDDIAQSSFGIHAVVSTEDPEIAAVARSLGVTVVDRPPELSAPDASSTAAVQHAVRSVEPVLGRLDVVVELYASTPVRPPGCLDICIERLLDSGADSTFCLEPVGKRHPAFCVALAPDGRMRSLWGEVPLARQQLPPAYHLTGAAYAIRRDVLLDPRQSGLPVTDPYAPFGRHRLGVVFEVGQTADIDEPYDLPWVEFLLARTEAIRA